LDLPRVNFLRASCYKSARDMDNPNGFRLQDMYSSWAAVDRLDRRVTRDVQALWSELGTLHIGTESPSPKYHLGIQHWIPEESAMSRLKPVQTLDDAGESSFYHASPASRLSETRSSSTWRRRWSVLPELSMT